MTARFVTCHNKQTFQTRSFDRGNVYRSGQHSTGRSKTVANRRLRPLLETLSVVQSGCLMKCLMKTIKNTRVKSFLQYTPHVNPFKLDFGFYIVFSTKTIGFQTSWYRNSYRITTEVLPGFRKFVDCDMHRNPARAAALVG